MYKYVEELALNGWPALHTFVYDGWLLRFADGYTKRSNSISPLYNGGEWSDEEKVARCEQMYAEAGLSTVFKLTPYVSSPGLDGLLDKRGYRIVDPSSVKLLDDLSMIGETRKEIVTIEERLTEKWLSHAAALMDLTEHQVVTTRQLLGHSHLTMGFFTLFDGEIPVACGMGVIENGYVGLYDIVTHPENRNRGHAEQLILHLLRWARGNGAKKSYLLVVQSNAPANRLYDKLGYREIYTYWYRVKDRGL